MSLICYSSVRHIIKEFDNDKDFEEFLINSFSEQKYEIDENINYKHDPNDLYHEEYKFYRRYIDIIINDYRYKNSCEQCKYPKHPNLSKADSLAFSLTNLTENNFIRLKHWDVSNIIDFTGCFSDSENVNTKIIRNWDVSNGLYFDSMFESAIETDVEGWNGFKYLKHWDCSKGLSYTCMFATIDDRLYKNSQINYEAISHMKVNPNADFKNIFCKLPKEEAEHFRNWFPDMNIEEILVKLC